MTMSLKVTRFRSTYLRDRWADSCTTRLDRTNLVEGKRRLICGGRTSRQRGGWSSRPR